MADTPHESTDETAQTNKPLQPAATQSDTPENSETSPESTNAKPDTASPNKFKRLLASYWSKKKWTLPVSLLVLIAVILAIPFTRYASLGLFLKKQVSISVVDSKTGTPVSGAAVSLAGKSLKTEGSGRATGNVRLGATTLQVSKQYYKSASQNITVTFSATHNNFKIKLAATGRQVPITVVNKITGKGINGVEIKVLNTEAKTDKNGHATIVLPTTATSQKATIQLGGYNITSVTVQVTDQVVAANTFNLVPAGKLYFLSNKNGKIDVVKTNLDGSNRQIVLAGTGTEDSNSTSLLASRDWKYLALLAKRDGKNASVYLIDTTDNDKLTTIDNGDANFTLVGWANDVFAYYINRHYDAWQPKLTAIKTYDAAAKKLNVAYETDAVGDANNYANESLSWIQQIGTKLIWYNTWSAHHQTYSTSFGELDGKQAQVVEYDTTKNAKKVLKSYTLPSTTTGYTTYFGPMTSYQSVVYAPDEVYFLIEANNSAGDNYYNEYDDGALKENSDAAKAYFQGNQATYPTYLDSPSTTKTLWTEPRDGKNTLFVGDESAKNQKQIAALSDYNPYGWYTDAYILVSKNSSELYILPADGTAAPQKITDYYKPPITYRGYGGGYGGL